VKRELLPARRMMKGTRENGTALAVLAL
jgi:hypothetical protein